MDVNEIKLILQRDDFEDEEKLDILVKDMLGEMTDKSKIEIMSLQHELMNNKTPYPKFRRKTFDKIIYLIEMETSELGKTVRELQDMKPLTELEFDIA